MPSADCTIEARFEASSFSVSVSSVDSSFASFPSGVVDGGGDYPCLSLVTVTAEAPSGYRFSEFVDSSTHEPISSLSAYSFKMPAESFSLSAVFVIRNSVSMPLLVVGETYSYGSYPQTLVSDTLQIGMLDSLSGEHPTADDAHSWTPYSRTFAGEEAATSWFRDLSVSSGGNTYRYRGLHFSSVPESESSAYEAGTVYFFKYEPIEWYVLSLSEGDSSLFLSSEKIIDARPFFHSTINLRGDGTSAYPNDYRQSDVRYWLHSSNADSISGAAFTKDERSMLGVSCLDNSAASTLTSSNPYASAKTTSDNLFLLSFRDVVTKAYGFENDANSYDPRRELQISDYAVCQGGYEYENPSKPASEYNGCGNWWLRSPFPDTEKAEYATSVSYRGYPQKNETVFSASGIAPAMKLYL